MADTNRVLNRCSKYTGLIKPFCRTPLSANSHTFSNEEQEMLYLCSAQQINTDILLEYPI